MKLAFLATIYLFSLTLAVAPQDDHTPVPQHSDWSHYRAIARLPRGITIPTTAPASGTPLPHDDAPAETPEDIDARQQWPWEKEPHVIGVYPDGRPKCRIMSMTAGHTEGPCPPKLSKEKIAEILRDEWCRNNCCDEEGEPCRA